MHAVHIVIIGRVQGVGFRPFVSRLAHELNLTGWVRNRSGRVEIHAQGSAQSLRCFERELIRRAPPLAQPETPTVAIVELADYPDFRILASAADETTDAHIPPDYFVCDDCLAEMQDPAERRYRYPFINCTQCGPRYTLIDGLPYDRPNTAMADFPLCPACQAEYSNPNDRRYHAQPLACARCGPGLLFRRLGFVDQTGNEAALAACLVALRAGLLVAVKGVGGYHLLCDATQSEPVRRLRLQKARPDKPLAVLVPWRGDDGLAVVDTLAELEPDERALLRSPLRPIVLGRKRLPSQLVDEIAPDLAEWGLMLPYSPLHHLLINDFGKPLVATSANISGEPVLTDGEEVESRLARVADAFLHHDRPILRPADDSVYRRIAGKPRPIRLGRGTAPLELAVPFSFGQPLLAVGADLKNTVALGFGRRLVVSPHIGNLGSPRSEQVFTQVIADLQRLYDVRPAAIVCDAHPGYHASRWARQAGLLVISVFHHYAHASALVGEHGVQDPMLVFTWDGTGYGEDGTIWGGETLLGTPGSWRRVGTLKTFRLPGGEKASREPWRCALAVCWEAGVEWQVGLPDAALLKSALEKGVNSPLTSSVGRLFDAAAALMDIGCYSSYEGHAAMRLEAISRADVPGLDLPLSFNGAGILVTDWRPLLPMLTNPALSKAERGGAFHASLARAIVDQAQHLREIHGVVNVGLTGGVFQNRLLTELAQGELIEQGFSVYLSERLPAGDGAISFGQLIEAAGKGK